MHNTDDLKKLSKGRVKIWVLLGCGLLAVVAGLTIQQGYWLGTAEAGNAEVKETASPASAAKYTCPMHPQVMTDKPGDCPICGMKLNPTKK